jgi:hypothetical protein
MKQADVRGACATVSVTGVASCNASFGKDFSAYAVAAALCMESHIDFFHSVTGQSVLVLIDRINNGRKELDAAEKILASDPWYSAKWAEEQFVWRHLTKPELTSNFRGKEAADFAAWEARINAEGLYGFTDKWQGNHWSMSRESVVALADAAPLNGFVYGPDKLVEVYSRLI